MIQHKANGKEFLMVEVPEGYDLFDVYKSKHIRINERVELLGEDFLRLLPENFRLITIGLASELSEEQAKEVVDIVMGDEYKSYGDDFNYLSARKSLYSLCQSHGMKAELTLIIQVK